MAESTIMLEKWAVAFKLLDFNKDGVISKLDRDACKQSFATVYKSISDESDTMFAELDSFWNKSVFLKGEVDWSKSFSPEDSLKTRQESYGTDPSGTLDVVREAMTHLVRAADVQGNKKFNLEEFKRLHEAFNLTDENLVLGLFKMMGVVDGYCSSESVIEFYTELTMGSDEGKHEMYKAALASVGFI
ncbi:hypothetical protein ACF0H5_000290 [Mactra antiquata]